MILRLISHKDGTQKGATTTHQFCNPKKAILDTRYEFKYSSFKGNIFFVSSFNFFILALMYLFFHLIVQVILFKGDGHKAKIVVHSISFGDYSG